MDATKRQAALLQAAANAVKRDGQSAAADLGMTVQQWDALVRGDARITWETLQRAARLWHFSERDFLPVRDDRIAGGLIMRRHESEASSRTIDRGGTPYYEYRDTAMSSVAPFRPEWIRMLVSVSEEGPGWERVRLNRGHLSYQFTFVVGQVNYYWEWEGERHFAQLSTGDTVWGLPFSRHGFARRGDSGAAFILALTYGGDLAGDQFNEAAVLGPGVASWLKLTPAAPDTMLDPDLIARQLESCLMSPQELSRLMGVSLGELQALLLRGDCSWSMALSIARALNTSVCDLMPPAHDLSGAIEIVRRPSSGAPYPNEPRPDYFVRRCAGSAVHGWVTAFELEVHNASLDHAAELPLYVHQYAYHLDGGDAHFAWTADTASVSEVTSPGDSVYLSPGCTLRLSATDEAAPPPRFVIQRAVGSVGPDSWYAYGRIERADLPRVTGESEQEWYSA